MHKKTLIIITLILGDIEDFPGLDSLPCYEVEVSEEGNVKVRADKQLLQANKRVKPFVRTLKAKTLTFMVAGGGKDQINIHLLRI